MFRKLANIILEMLKSNGGSMTYRDLHSSVEPVQVRHLPAALKLLKADKSVRQEVAFDSATSKVEHRVLLMDGGD